MIFDTHAHYDDDAFDMDRDDLLNHLHQTTVGVIVNVGASFKGAVDSIALAEKYPFVLAAVGIHPDHCKELDEACMEKLKQMSRHEKCVAIGEIGLDYHWNVEEPKVQQQKMIDQLCLAKEVDLPVIIHSRESTADTLEIMKRHHAHTTSGVIHCFPGSKEIAAEYLKLGYFLGIGGVVTFKNGRVLKEVVEYAPMDSLVIETDSPYLSPVPFRGKRNDSGRLSHVISEIAAIKGMDPKEVERITFENACRLYRREKDGITGKAFKS